MKVARAHLSRFKRFADFEFDARTARQGHRQQLPHRWGQRHGQNDRAAGYCSLLVDAASTTRGVRDFDWLGWVPGRFERWGKPVVELEIHFTKPEIEATREAALRWFRSRNGEAEGREFIEPADSPVSYRTDGG